MYKFGLIGNPIKHSLSPWIHNQFFKKSQIRGEYNLYEIKDDESLKHAIEDLVHKEIDGFNVTVPYKEKIMPYLDEIDDEASKIGAVNTVVIKEKKLKGYNTDGIGYVRSLEQGHPLLKDEREEKKILLLGGGGAARGIYYALMKTGYNKIDLANRTLENAEKIADLKGSMTETEVLSLEEAKEHLGNYDILIQTTSVGMRPNIDQSIISLNNIKPQAIASDIVYQPIQTKFLDEAKEKGAKIHHGHTMLLYQAQYAFELWTDQKVSAKHLDEQLKHILEGV